MKSVCLISAIVLSMCASVVTISVGAVADNVEKSVTQSALPARSAISVTDDAKPLSCFVPKNMVVAAAVKRKTRAIPAATVPVPLVLVRSLVEPLTGMEFLPVPAGCFQMGVNSGELDAMPLHQVCLDAFFIGKYEVTQGQWARIMGDQPSFFNSCGKNCPVDNVSWRDAQDFISILNRLNGKNYRLLTEAEWEYACRSGGKTERFCGGLDVDTAAWYDRNSNSKPHPVGEKRPNGLGIYDMSGNVWEWVSDLYQSPLLNQNIDGVLAENRRVMRGGSWYNDAKNVSSSLRAGDLPESRSINLGFRIGYSAR